MSPKHSLITNLRLWSVQAGLVGGALTAFLATLQQNGVAVPPAVLAASGIITAAGVFAARLFPQPDVSEGDEP